MIQNENSNSHRSRQFQAEPGGTLGKGSVAELDKTLAIMANEVSMMWEQLLDVACSPVGIMRVNASLIDKVTAVKFILEADADRIKVYKENNKEICTWRICAEGKHQLFMGRKHFAALYRKLQWHDSPFEIRSQQRLGVMLVPLLVEA